MLDDSTNHFIAHHSAWQWVELRSFLTCKIFFAIGIIGAIAYKGYSDVEVIIMLVFYSNADWIIHIFGTYQWVQRSFVKVARVYNLMDIPQEKFKEGKIPPKSWPEVGEIDF